MDSLSRRVRKNKSAKIILLNFCETVPKEELCGFLLTLNYKTDSLTDQKRGDRPYL